VSKIIHGREEKKGGKNHECPAKSEKPESSWGLPLCAKRHREGAKQVEGKGSTWKGKDEGETLPKRFVDGGTETKGWGRKSPGRNKNQTDTVEGGLRKKK